MATEKKASPKLKPNKDKATFKNPRGRKSKAKKITSNPRIKKALTRSQLNRVFDLGKHQCTYREIAADVGIGKTTVVEWTTVGGNYYYPEFVDYMERGKAEGRKMLRSKQVELALDGNVTMLIWVGKQVLDQREVKALEVTKVNDELDIVLDEASLELFNPPKAKKGKGKK